MLAISKKPLGRQQTTATMTVPDDKTIPHMPPLHTACHRGSMAEVKKWVEMGEDVNEQTKVSTLKEESVRTHSANVRLQNYRA
mmetsp:Transcript_23525/g.76653  ORF Transcript_23525/g.76653 Transcript_23525/m.76653 type:complete len:83 (+) Transcript_23525:134-382(+)